MRYKCPFTVKVLSSRIATRQYQNTKHKTHKAQTTKYFRFISSKFFPTWPYLIGFLLHPGSSTLFNRFRFQFTKCITELIDLKSQSFYPKMPKIFKYYRKLFSCLKYIWTSYKYLFIHNKYVIYTENKYLFYLKNVKIFLKCVITNKNLK